MNRQTCRIGNRDCEFSIYQLKSNRHRTPKWVVKFKDPDTGRWSPAKSIDVLAKQQGIARSITTREEAEEILYKAEKMGTIGTGTVENTGDLVEFMLSFWDFDTSVYIARENKLNPDSIGRDHAHNSRNNIRNHVKPYLPEGLKCSQLRREHIEAIQTAILRDNGFSVWKNTRTAMKRPIQELIRTGVLTVDPFFGVPDAKRNRRQEKQKGALTPEETDRLIAQMRWRLSHEVEREVVVRTARREYRTRRTSVINRAVYLAIALSSCTGMRQSEVLSIRTSDIRNPSNGEDSENQAIIGIVRSYGRKAGFKLPKAKEPRKVPVPRWLADELLELGQTNPWGENLIFYSTKKPGIPMTHNILSDGFDMEVDLMFGKEEMERVLGKPLSLTEILSNDALYGKIMEEGKRIRNTREITYHSTRRFFDTQSFELVGGERTRIVIGHKSEAMTQHYHVTTDKQILSVGKETTRLIKPPEDTEN